MNDRTCKRCGAWEGLHHFDTMQCPWGGYEAPIGKQQRWSSQTFEETEFIEPVNQDALATGGQREVSDKRKENLMRDPKDIMHNGKTIAEWLEINKTNDADLRGANLRGAVYKGVKVMFLCSLGRLYTYNVVVVISDDNTIYVGLGCYFRKAIDWQNDFWNNKSEFPNDGSIKTQERELALDFSVKFALLHGGEVKS